MSKKGAKRKRRKIHGMAKKTEDARKRRERREFGLAGVRADENRRAT